MRRRIGPPLLRTEPPGASARRTSTRRHIFLFCRTADPLRARARRGGAADRCESRQLDAGDGVRRFGLGRRFQRLCRAVQAVAGMGSADLVRPHLKCGEHKRAAQEFRLGFGVLWYCRWCCRTGLNCRPLPYQGSALPLSYGSEPVWLSPGLKAGLARGHIHLRENAAVIATGRGPSASAVTFPAGLRSVPAGGCGVPSCVL